MKVVFLGPAEEEMLEAARFYEKQATRLGYDFLHEVNHVSKRIQEHPYAAPLVLGQVRRCILKRFPFGILYRIDDDIISVLAVMHLRRKPNYWFGRL